MSKLMDQPELAQANDDEEIVDLNEIEEVLQEDTSEEPQSQGTDVPDKFKNKSFEDVVDMYRNLEKEYGRKGNEIGELRKLTDQLLELEIQQKKNQQQRVTTKEEEVLSDDEWFSSPKKATDKYLQNSSLAREVNQLKEQMTTREREVLHQKFMEKHSDYNDLIKEPEFADFVKESKYRQELAVKADAFDYEAADELFNLYKTIRQARGVSEPTKNTEQERKKATLESAGNRNKGTKKVYRRADLIKMKMTDPDRYNAMQDDIMLAYQEGRVK